MNLKQWWYLVALIFGLVSLANTAAAGGLPLKLQVMVPHQPIWSGAEAIVRIELRGAADQAVTSEKEESIKLSMERPSGAIDVIQVAIAPKTSAGETMVRFEKPGVHALTATHPQLLSAGAIVMVKAHGIPASQAEPPEQTRSSGSGSSDILALLAARQAATPQIQMKLTPNRPLMADGKDRARVYAFITGETPIALQDIKVRLHTDNGRLDPSDLIIPRGEFGADANVTSDQVGTAHVEFIGAVPSATLVGSHRLSIDFVPPIAGIELVASPPDLTTIESAELIVRLIDNNGRPVNSHVERTVSFAINAGSGKLSETKAAIAKGQA